MWQWSSAKLNHKESPKMTSTKLNRIFLRSAANWSKFWRTVEWTQTCQLLRMLVGTPNICSEANCTRFKKDNAFSGSGGKKNRQKERRLMKGFNIAPPPGSTGSLAPVQEQFSTSLDQSDQAQLTQTLQNLFSNSFLNKNKSATQSCSTNNFNSFNSSTSTTSNGTPPVHEHIAGTKYNKNCLKTYNKRMSGQKKKWGEFERKCSVNFLI